MGSPGWEGQAEPGDGDDRKASPGNPHDVLSVNWEGFSVFKVLLEGLGLMSLSKPQEAVKDGSLAHAVHVGHKNRTRPAPEQQQCNLQKLSKRRTRERLLSSEKKMSIDQKVNLHELGRWGEVCLCLVYETPHCHFTYKAQNWN